MNGFKNFIAHLRLRFQLLVAPMSFLLGLLLSPSRIGGADAFIQFLNVHILLFGAGTVFNSYYDHDTVPVEGLEHPPPMQRWMLFSSLALHAAGFLIAFAAGNITAFLFAAGIAVSIAYSHPAIRLKSRPIASLVVIGFWGGILPFLIGYSLYGFLGSRSLALISGTIAAALLTLAMFPLAQAHQIEEDRRKGDRTFSAVYGIRGIKIFFLIAAPLGILFMGFSLAHIYPLLGALFAFFGFIGIALLWHLRIRHIKGTEEEYRRIFMLKFYSGLLLNIFLLFLIFLKSQNAL